MLSPLASAATVLALEVRSLSELISPPSPSSSFFFFYPISLLLVPSVSLRLSLSSASPHPAHLGLILGEHLTDVLLKDEKRSGGESKSKQRSAKRRRGGTRQDGKDTAEHTFTHTSTRAEAQRIIASATLDTSGKRTSAHSMFDSA